MSDITGPIYEVTISVDPEVIAEFDAWLVSHVDEMLEIPGFARASLYAADDDDNGWTRRVTHYFLDSEADLEKYLAGPAEVMRQSAVEHFDGKFVASRRILHSADVTDGALKPIELCLNCATALSGQYCGNCGQRARSRLISIWELLQDAFGDLLELDSRVWRTVIPLLIRPGKLTRDYLEGRRVRFMPPFRMYLVLSIFFFLIAFFDPKEELGILYEPEAEVAAETNVVNEDEQQIRQQVLRELAEDGLIDAEQFDLTDDTEAADEVDTADTESDPEEDSDSLRITLDDEALDTECDLGDFDNQDFPPWLASRLTEERLTAICERIVADDGRAFIEKLLENVPAALFILLPLMALVLKVLYPLSKRFYVEHLLFVVHFHAFVFLILILQILFTRLVELLTLPDAIADVAITAASLYIPVYLYKSMRRVYEQGRLVTIPKYLILMAAYFAGFSFIFLFAAVFAAFSM